MTTPCTCMEGGMETFHTETCGSLTLVSIPVYSRPYFEKPLENRTCDVAVNHEWPYKAMADTIQ